MRQFWLLLALKFVTFCAATAQTVGFVGFFAFEALQPYKWQLFVGGTLVIALSLWATSVLAKQMAAGSRDETPALDQS